MISNVRPDIGLYQAKYWLRGYLRNISGIGKLDPNVLSLFALVPGAVAAYCLYCGWWLAGAIAIVCRMIVNTLDGLIAEEFNKTSNLGAYLNRAPGEVTDLLIALSLYPYVPAIESVALIVLISWVQTFGLIPLVAQGKTQSVGPCGQTDRLAIIAVSSVIASLGFKVWPYVIAAMCIGCIVTIALRIKRAVTQISKLDSIGQVGT